MIELKHLHKYFDKGRAAEIHVINDITLSLPERGMVAVFGKSGCGKTTLLNVIGGLDRFDDGTLTVADRDIGQDPDITRNRYMGYIFQNYNLHANQTCFTNVAAALRLCGMRDETEIATRVRAALRNVGMEKYEKRTPDTLSGGQQQRVAIARAIVKNPRIILADEPTGNLDEANTVMIMDLLKRISRDHLVLLVTHEAELVDHYCDTVIELCDGAVVSVRENDAANGYVARSKNDIYLGELQKTVFLGEAADVLYYGDLPSTPVKIKLVNCGGKLYCKVDTAGVQVLDDSAETKLREGVFEKAEQKAIGEQQIDMSALPPVEGTCYGRLFTFFSSLISGFRANFRKSKRGKKALVGCLCLFAAALVTMSAVFGTAIKTLIHASESYNHNVFYVYTPNGAVSAALNSAPLADSGIDGVRLSYQYPNGDQYTRFHPGNFETFGTGGYVSGYETNAVYLDCRLAKDLDVVVGKRDIADNEMLITTAVADKLLENSSLGYVSEYKDLLGLVFTSFSAGNGSIHVAGVVESRETAVYFSELTMARYVIGGVSDEIALGADLNVSLAAGEAVVVINSATLAYTKDTVLVNGRELRVREVRRNYSSYTQWLAAKGIVRDSSDAYFEAIVRAENPTLDPASKAFADAKNAVISALTYDYLAYYYAYYDEFLADRYFFEQDDLDLFILCEMHVEDMKYAFFNEGEQLFLAEKYKALYGRYPTVTELEAAKKNLPDYYDTVKSYEYFYEDMFYGRESVYFPDGGVRYLLAQEDYIAVSRQYGETTVIASYAQDADEKAYQATKNVLTEYDVDYYIPSLYTVVHSVDPEKTQAWLWDNFPELDTGDAYLQAILTPSGVFESLTKSIAAEILAGLVAMAVVLVLMSICMYFIMRSSLMNRVREIGIWRAIGVSRRNLAFRFLVEALVLTVLTVFVGYLVSSIFVYACMSLTPLMAEIFFYPIWLALGVLLVLIAVSLLCGTLPILLLLRKSPAEILAKYDI
ncbi:MAG: ABC transporter ATP-binding protein/permease [Clostridia bacterium]|nr:ABC transporter ATP-binding protein/permease [Clostridia bacterium]